MTTIISAAAVVGLVAVCVRELMPKKGKKGSCCGNCAGCSGCSCGCSSKR